MTKSPANPTANEAANTSKKPVDRTLPKRFYDQVSVESQDGGFVLQLDYRHVRTPKRAMFVVPTRALADAVGEEWRQQTEVIDPETMPITKLCNSTLDGVVPNRTVVVDDIANYAKHDAICYRASEPDALVTRQNQQLDPIIDWAHAHFGVRWVCTKGVIPVSQPEKVDKVVRSALAKMSAFQLTALHEITTLTGSTLLALAYDQNQLSCEALWQGAHIDEDFQIERWGQDGEAEERRQRRWREAAAADCLYKLAGQHETSF